MRIANLLGIAVAIIVTVVILHGTAAAGIGGAPELDPGMTTGGLTILGIGIVLLLERYRRN